MIRILIRLAGLVLLAAAFALVLMDGVRSISAGVIWQTSLNSLIGQISPEHLVSFETTVRTQFPAWVWSPVVTDALSLPSWFVAAGLGLLLMRLSRKPAPTIGYSSRD